MTRADAGLRDEQQRKEVFVWFGAASYWAVLVHTVLVNGEDF